MEQKYEDLKREIKALKADRERLRTRAFWLMAEFAFIFLVPAFIALFLGEWLDKTLSSPVVLYILLGLAFIGSWVIVLVRVRKLDKKLQELDQVIKDKTQQLSS